MITETERRWVGEALRQIYNGELSTIHSAKMMRTISQIFERGARILELEVIEEVDAKLQRNYQDQQNQRLVDILKR